MEVQQCCSDCSRSVLVSAWCILQWAKLVFTENLQHSEVPVVVQFQEEWKETLSILSLLGKLEHIKHKLFHFHSIGLCWVYPGINSYGERQSS